ncbi:hypothetical protein [Sulfuricurvum sp.]|uniref:hypothetical protein n=1 Tax=Sulfuricurvum sp. TaxID=2025608 RepID=UPI003BAE1B9B
MSEAIEAALNKAGFQIEKMKKRIKELETPKTCHTCIVFVDSGCNHEDVPDFDVCTYIHFSGCGLYEPNFDALEAQYILQEIRRTG